MDQQMSARLLKALQFTVLDNSYSRTKRISISFQPTASSGTQQSEYVIWYSPNDRPIRYPLTRLILRIRIPRQHLQTLRKRLHRNIPCVSTEFVIESMMSGKSGVVVCRRVGIVGGPVNLRGPVRKREQGAGD